MSEKTAFNDINSVILLKVPKRLGNKCVHWLKTHDKMDETYKIIQYHDVLLIPINTKCLELPEELSAPPFEILEFPSEKIDSELMEFINTHLQRNNLLEKHVPSLTQALQGKIPSECLEALPHSFDVIGSIAILEINREEQLILRPFVKLIGETMLATNKNLSAVFEKAGEVNGIFRTRQLQLVAGNPTTVTVHKENGCVFEVDIATTFFTPRLVFERNRVSEIDSHFITQGITWDMFCGVGPFLIQIAKKHPEGNYIGTDINPNAVTSAMKNAKLNKLKCQYAFHIQDLSELSSNNTQTPLQAILNNKVSRIIMNLPEKNLEFIPILPTFIHPLGALLHIYQFNPNTDALNDAIVQLKQALSKGNLICKEVLGQRIVKSFSPSLDTTALDVVIARS